jgi:hypothetical protein
VAGGLYSRLLREDPSWRAYVRSDLRIAYAAVRKIADVVRGTDLSAWQKMQVIFVVAVRAACRAMELTRLRLGGKER